jgi:hypothetical protein
VSDERRGELVVIMVISVDGCPSQWLEFAVQSSPAKCDCLYMSVHTHRLRLC